MSNIIFYNVYKFDVILPIFVPSSTFTSSFQTLPLSGFLVRIVFDTIMIYLRETQYTHYFHSFSFSFFLILFSGFAVQNILVCMHGIINGLLTWSVSLIFSFTFFKNIHQSFVLSLVLITKKENKERWTKALNKNWAKA